MLYLIMYGTIITVVKRFMVQPRDLLDLVYVPHVTVELQPIVVERVMLSVVVPSLPLLSK